jgi:hypothetical protein
MATDPSVLPTSSPVLQHTLNTEGNLGLFVNPYTCDCETCKEYLKKDRQTDGTPDAHRALLNSPIQALTTVPPDIPGPPRLRRVNAWSVRVNPETTQEAIESDAMAKLLSLHTFLKVKQRRCSEAADAAADLDHKLRALERTLEAFGIHL